MSEVVLSAEKRIETGKGVAGRLRRAGRIPGVMYGAKIEPDAISFDKIELGRLLRKDHSIINVKVGSDDQKAVIKEIQNHPVSGEVTHVDFMRVVAGQEITVSVPFQFVGVAEGTKHGGVLTTLLNEIQISVMPRFMPENIEVDISNLDIGDSIRIDDLGLENMTALSEGNELIVQVVQQRKEEVEETDELLEDTESAEPEVITAREDEKESE
jgi:large subunit ribosomal protein L25